MKFSANIHRVPSLEIYSSFRFQHRIKYLPFLKQFQFCYSSRLSLQALLFVMKVHIKLKNIFFNYFHEYFKVLTNKLLLIFWRMFVFKPCYEHIFKICLWIANYVYYITNNRYLLHLSYNANNIKDNCAFLLIRTRMEWEIWKAPRGIKVTLIITI